MKKIIISSLFILKIISLLWGADASQEYHGQALKILEAKGLIYLWDEHEKTDLTGALYQERISLQVLRLVAKNLPDDMDMESVGGLKGFLISAGLQMDTLMKRGLETGKARLVIREYVKTAQKDWQRKQSMLKLHAGEENENPEAQYRYKQIFNYQQNKETEAGGNGGNQQGGEGPPQSPITDQNEGNAAKG